MKNSKSIFFIFLFLSSLTFSQEKLLTVEDVVLNSFSQLYPSNLKQLQWIPNTYNYSYVDKPVEVTNLYKASASSGRREKIISLPDLNNQLKSIGFEELKNFPKISWISEDTLTFWLKENFISLDISSYEIKIINRVTENSSNRSVAGNNQYVAYTVDNNLYIAINDTEIKQLTNDEDTEIVNGQTVHRNEFGISGGIFWSPKSKYLAFYRKDERMVTNYPLVNIDETPAKVENIKYPMAGQSSHHVTIGIYNIETQQTVWLNTGEPKEQYLTNVTWGPEEKYIYVAHLNRDQNHMRLVKYDVLTGKPVKNLFDEKDNEYVEPENKLIFLPNDKDKFLWFSERDGWNHLYLYDTDGKLIKQITKGDWVVLSLNGFDKSGENIFITSTQESPVERHYYKVNLKSGDNYKFTKTAGNHRVTKNSDGNYFIDSFNSLDVPREIRIINKDGQLISIIHKSENPLKEYKMGETKIFKIKSENDIDLYCKMILPPEFDKNKKYPVVVYVYGGPHDQLVTKSWQRASWQQMMAQKDFIVFTVDNRGSANRGLEFEQATFRNLGAKEIADQLKGVDYLKSFDYVDSNRIGVFGWSYGGFMTTSLMLRTNDTYKVGVGGSAVIDWRFYEVMYTERYMDTPESNPDGYNDANLLNYVENLSGKLLLVHGTSDPVVVWQHSLSFAKKAASLNKPLDYYPYLGHGHGVKGSDAVHLYTKITNYFLDNL